MNRAVVYTPKSLDDSERKKAGELVKKLTGESQTETYFEKDEKLIDGLKIVYGDKLWDFSLQSQLNSLKNP